MSVNQLRKEVNIIQKALNINCSVPDWKQRSNDIQALLKEWAKVPQEEKDQSNREVLEWYKGAVSRNG